MIQSARVQQTILGTYVLPIAIGMAVMVLSAQLSVHLPNTPVPVTGQTLGVLLVAMSLGRVRGTAAIAGYIGAGMLGAPVFADFASMSAMWGPDAGYIYGFIPMAFAAGWLADRGWTRNPFLGTAAGLIAHAVVMACGVSVLAAFVGSNNVWAMGVAPFLVGTLVKCVVAGVAAKYIRKA